MLDVPALALEYVVNGRDLRLDFLRGMVMIVVVCVHLQYLSLFSMFMWERLGMFSSAEGFVSLSGIVLGIVYKNHLLKLGFRSAAFKLLKRAFQLYRVNVLIILSIIALSYIPSINVYQVTHWTSPLKGGSAFFLFPLAQTPWLTVVKQVLLLQVGPHQFQVVGLYAILITLAPLVLFLLYRRQTAGLLLLSWGLYCINAWWDIKVTPARFEVAFPLLTWQLLFFNGMIVGFHHQKVFAFLADRQHKVLILFAAFCLCLFMLFAVCNPEPLCWPWQTVHYVSAEAYSHVYSTWFEKNHLGIGRVVNNILLYMTLFAFVSWHWQACNRYFGWLLIPIGQASLYVFIWHVYFVLFWSNTALPTYNNFWLNSIMHLCSVALIWLMVKKKFMFAFVPR